MGVYDQQFIKLTIGWQKEEEFTQFCGGGIVDLPSTTN